MSPYEGTSTTQHNSSSGSSRPPSQGNMPQMPPNMPGMSGMGGGQHHSNMSNPYGFQQHRGSMGSMGNQQLSMHNMMMGGDNSGSNNNMAGGGFVNAPSNSRGGGMYPNQSMNMNMGGQFHNGPGSMSGNMSGQNSMYNNFNGQQQNQMQNQMQYNNTHGGQQSQQQHHGGYNQHTQQQMQQHGGNLNNGMGHNSQYQNHSMQRQHSNHQQNYHSQQQLQQEQQRQQHQGQRQQQMQEQMQQQQMNQYQMNQQQQGYSSNQNYHRQPSSAHSHSHSHPDSPSTPNPNDPNDGGLLSYKHPPNFSEVMGLDFELGDYGAQFLPTGLNGDWQSDRDMRHRREMIQHIVKLLKQKDKNASPEWLTKLPQMVKQLEVSLYRSAPSFNEYADISTLKHRLQQLAMEIARKTQQAKESRGRSSSRGRDRQSSSSAVPQAQHSSQNDHHVMGGMRFHSTRADEDDRVSSQHGNPKDPEWKVRIRHKQQRLLLLHHSSKCPYDDGKCKVTPYCGEMKKLWKHMARCVDNECRVPHCFSSRSILSHYRKCKDARCPACGPVRDTVRKTLKSSSSGRRGNGMGDGPHSGGGQDSINLGIGLGGLDSAEFLQQGDQFDQPLSMNPMSRGNTPGVGQMMDPQDMHRQSMHQANSPMPFSGEVPSMPYGAPESGNSGGGIQSSSQGGNHAFPESLVNNNGSQNGPPGGPRSDRDPDSSKSRHKQQRLLLLRHASKCNVPTGRCTVTPHCAEMKILWRHIANCKEPQCKIKHCMSSRYVLSHYRRCRDSYCDICGPVRETIKNGTATFIHDPTFNPTGENMTPPSSNQEGPQLKRQKTSHDQDMINGMPPPQNRQPTPAGGEMGSYSTDRLAALAPRAPTSGEENRAKSKPEEKAAASSSSSEDHSLLECFTTQQVKTHIESLKKTVQVPPATLKLKCMEVLKGLQTHEHGWVFATPVDPVELGLEDYFEIIKKPMDLGTIQKKLEAGSYHAFGDFKSDVRLTFENAMKYNEENTVVHEMAKELKKKFDVDYKKLMKQLDKEHQEDSKKAQACGLCGCEKLDFEPPVFFCNGLNCPSKRIRRNTHFYITSDKQYAWCNQCFNELGNEIDLGVSKLKKEELTKRKNDETHEESWVQCDDCERWIHQICGLYNTRQDKENKSAYSCPLCLYEKRKKEGDPPNLPPAPSANDIPRTKLSDWLEKDVLKKVNDRLRELAKEKSETENTSFEKAYKEVASGGTLTIRQVTSTDRRLEVRERMKARYAHKSYPDEFPYRCKCIVVFQNIDGVDVVLFALYVYEHGDDNPFPNKKTVYVSYLDSVHFMKPRNIRTFIYHEILTSYLDYARQKGYEQAFIWACPPLKGDDYIFYAKPEDQKTPKDVRLRQWYLDMLAECQRREIVGKVTNMYDEYFNNKKLDAADVPYFEGDYFPGEAENIIKLLEEGDGKRKSSAGKKKKDLKRERSNSTAGEESEDKFFKEGGRDPVMQKFCDAIQGMKESFIVAFLNCKDANPENLVVPKEIMKFRESKLKSVEGDIDADNRDSEKRDADGNEKSDEQTDRKGRLVKVLDDDAEEIDCEFFNTRQCFLDLCRGNHYQFDELRRAKHTSMMVLWHLQNREAPKFVQQCFSCNREILSGVRHHCTVCSDFDLCDECFRSPNANRGTCNHKLEVVKVDTSQNNANGLTEEQRRERQRNIQLHITLIEHASRCTTSQCKSTNCLKMKTYIKHGEQCKIKASGGCKICKRIWTLLRIHAQQCKNNNCSIPQCIAIKKRLRQLQQKQQAMDDRRRQEMNRHYRMGMMSDNN